MAKCASFLPAQDAEDARFRTREGGLQYASRSDARCSAWAAWPAIRGMAVAWLMPDGAEHVPSTRAAWPDRSRSRPEDLGGAASSRRNDLVSLTSRGCLRRAEQRAGRIGRPGGHQGGVWRGALGPVAQPDDAPASRASRHADAVAARTGRLRIATPCPRSGTRRGRDSSRTGHRPSRPSAGCGHH